MSDFDFDKENRPEKRRTVSSPSTLFSPASRNASKKPFTQSKLCGRLIADPNLEQTLAETTLNMSSLGVEDSAITSVSKTEVNSVKADPNLEATFLEGTFTETDLCGVSVVEKKNCCVKADPNLEATHLEAIFTESSSHVAEHSLLGCSKNVDSNHEATYQQATFDSLDEEISPGSGTHPDFETSLEEHSPMNLAVTDEDGYRHKKKYELRTPVPDFKETQNDSVVTCVRKAEDEILQSDEIGINETNANLCTHIQESNSSIVTDKVNPYLVICYCSGENDNPTAEAMCTPEVDSLDGAYLKTTFNETKSIVSPLNDRTDSDDQYEDTVSNLSSVFICDAPVKSYGEAVTGCSEVDSFVDVNKQDENAKEVGELWEQLRAEKQERCYLETELATLNSRFDAAKREHRDEVIGLRRRIDELIKQCETLERRCQIAESDLISFKSTADEQKNKLIDKIVELEENAGNLQDAENNAKTVAVEVEKKLERTELLASEIAHENRQQTETIAALKNRIKILDDEISALKAQKESSADQDEFGQAVEFGMSSLIVQVNEKMSEVGVSLNDREVFDLELSALRKDNEIQAVIIEEKTARVLSLESLLREKESRLESANSLQQELQCRLDDLNQERRAIEAAFQEELLSLKTGLTEKETILESERERLFEMNTRLNEMAQKEIEQKNLIRSLEDEVESGRRLNSKLNGDLSTEKVKSVDLAAQVHTLTVDLQSAMNSRLEISKEKESLLNEIQLLRQNTEKEINANKKMEDTLSALHITLHEQKKFVEDEKELKKELLEKLKVAESELENAERTLNSETKAKEDLQMKVGLLEEAMQKQQHQIEGILTDFRMKEDQMRVKVDEWESLLHCKDESMRRLTETLNALEKTHERSKEQNSRIISDLQREKRELEENFAFKKEHYEKSLRDQIEMLAQIETEMTREKSRWLDEKSALQADVGERLRDQKEQYERLLLDRHHEEDELKKKLEESYDKCQKLEQHQQKIIDEARAKYENLVTENRCLMNDLENLKLEVKNYEGLAEELRSKQQAEKEELRMLLDQDAKNKMEEMTENLKRNFTQQIERLEEEKKHLNLELDSTKSKLWDVEVELMEAKKTCDHLSTAEENERRLELALDEKILENERLKTCLENHREVSEKLMEIEEENKNLILSKEYLERMCDEADEQISSLKAKIFHLHEKVVLLESSKDNLSWEEIARKLGRVDVKPQKLMMVTNVIDSSVSTEGTESSSSSAPFNHDLQSSVKKPYAVSTQEKSSPKRTGTRSKSGNGNSSCRQQ
ncbi:hypothetical protein AB6A40_001877 [Gnathostoma spinigerum]|uniref:Uncharacterized protein n=1 Tax=Gnathostoma spinigerum TaxID=75299 RepID=A0ABD6E5C6_9BILA